MRRKSLTKRVTRLTANVLLALVLWVSMATYSLRVSLGSLGKQLQQTTRCLSTSSRRHKRRLTSWLRNVGNVLTVKVMVYATHICLLLLLTLILAFYAVVVPVLSQ